MNKEKNKLKQFAEANGSDLDWYRIEVCCHMMCPKMSPFGHVGCQSKDNKCFYEGTAKARLRSV